ncbi:MAG: putative metalloprotease CJM1_0395 family protein [Pseudomonadota bacterium]
MEPLSITLSAGGKPFLTTRVRSVTFDNAARVGAADRTGNAPRSEATGRQGDIGSLDASRTPEVEPAVPPTPPEQGAGFGAEARRAAVVSNLISEAANQSGAPGKAAKAAGYADGLTEAERDQIEKLKARDAEVKRHEQAHASVGGRYASAPTYTYQLGPDGRRYAIGGEVKIDIAPVAGDPEATIDKMSVVKAAALAPAEPSAADRQVASIADAQRLEAVAELASLRTEERFEVFDDTSEPVAGSSDDNGNGETSSHSTSRFADAASILSRGEESLPGQKLDTAA